MAKINPIMGKVRGKLGGLVYAAAGGENIVREKAATVTNPNTEAQIKTRAKFKLMSQLAAVVRPVLAIKKQGLKSSGNIFVSENFDLADYLNDTATINLNGVQLTKGVLAIPAFTANREDGQHINVKLNEDVSETYDKVVYAALIKSDSNELSLLDSAVAEAGSNNDFEANMLYTDKAVVIYAYAMRENTEDAQAKFGNLVAPTAERVAQLITSTSISTSDVSLSKTVGLTMLVGEDEVSSDDVEHFLVSVTKSGNGSVSGGGRYAAGQTATLIATPDSEASFDGWYLNSVSGTRVSTEARYQFVVEANISLVGKFLGGPVPTYTISVASADDTMGSVSGGGTKQEGATATIVATPNEGYRFVAWKRGNTIVSTSASYSFEVVGDDSLTAYFEEIPASDWEDVTFAGSAWANNISRTYPTSASIVATNNSLEISRIGMLQSENAPEAGDQIELSTSISTEASGGVAATFNFSSPSEGTYWLVAAKWDETANKYIVVDVYPYKLTVDSGEGGL